jgi:hypothetical protein
VKSHALKVSHVADASIRRHFASNRVFRLFAQFLSTPGLSRTSA